MATVDKFYIYNIDTKKDVLELKDDITLYFEDLPSNVSIRVKAGGAQSVKVALNNVVTVQNAEPYLVPALFSDGENLLSARSFEKDDCQGVISAKRVANFIVKHKTATVVGDGKIGKTFIRDIKNNKDFAELIEGQVIDPKKLPNEWNLRTEINKPDHAKLTINNKSNVEYKEPWCLFGDNVAFKLGDGPQEHTIVSFDKSNKQLDNKVIKFTIKSGTTNPPVPPLPSKVPFFGVVTGTKSDFTKLTNMFKEVGIRGIRVWLSVDWNNAEKLNHLKKFKDAGYAITACFTTSKVPTYEQAKKFFTDSEKLNGDIVDYWEIINEPDLPKYFEGSLKEYVDKVLKPAYEVLNSKNRIVIGGGVSEEVRELKELISYGYLNYCHYANYHPYANTPKEHIQRVKDAKALVGNKPLVITEWNMHARWGGLSYQEWADSLDFVFQSIRDYVDGVWYYRSVVSGQYAGAAGILKADLTKNQLFYDGVKNIDKL